MENIELQNLEEYIKRNSQRTQNDRKATILIFFTFYMSITNYHFSVEIIEFLKNRNFRETKAEAEENKTPLISQKTYQYYRDKSFEILKDESQPFNLRKSMGVVFLQSQLGLRTSEIIILKEDSLVVIQRGKIKSAYVKYLSTKDARGTQKYVEHEIVANELVEEAFEILKKMNEGRYNPEHYLFLKESKTSQSKTNATGHINVDLYREWFKKVFEKLNDEKHLSYREFRVYVDSDLRARGISPRLIQKMYGHSDTMLDYYGRSDHPLQEDLVFTSGILKEIIEDDLTIMGPNGPVDKAVLNDLVSKNCKAKIEDVVDEAAGLFPIKSTRGGFCMRLHPVKECETDTELDPIFCSYDECPNRAHLYFNIAQNWKKAEDEFVILEYNIEAELENFAQKQGYVLRNTLNRKVKPELEELKKEMEKGNVLEKHPELEEIVKNIDDIEKKIKKMEEVIDKTCPN